MNDLNGTALAALAAALAPHIAQELAKLNGGAAASGGTAVVQQGGGFGATQQLGQQTQQANPFGTAAAVAATPTVTPDMIQQLITPLVQNDQVKQALTAEMQAMGINNLPDATPAQLPELYERFKKVDQIARTNGLVGGGAAATPGLI